MTRRRLVVAALAFVGCLDLHTEDPCARFAGEVGCASDGGLTGDAGTVDSGADDSGAPDSGASDSGASDSGVPDSGTPDSGAPDSGAPDSGVPDAGPERLLVKRFSRFIDGAGAVRDVASMRTDEQVEVLFALDGGWSSPISATSFDADAGWSFEVPPGDRFVRVTSATGAQSYFVMRRPSLELGTAALGRPDGARPDDGSRLDVTLSGFGGAGPLSQNTATLTTQPVMRATTPLPAANGTVSFTFRITDASNRLLGSAGDRALVFANDTLPGNALPDGGPVLTVMSVGCPIPPGFDMAQSGTSTITAPCITTPSVWQLSANAPAYLAMRAQMATAPQGGSMKFALEAGPPSNAAGDRGAQFPVATLFTTEAIPSHNYPVINALPAGFVTTTSAQLLFNGRANIADGGYDITLAVESQVLGFQFAATPRLTPPNTLMVNGQPAFQGPELRGVGLTPTLAWQPPTTGTVTTYRLQLNDIDLGPPATSSTPLVVITDQTSFTVPAGLLQVGHHYMVILTARHTTLPRHLAEPLRLGREFDTVQVLFDAISP